MDFLKCKMTKLLNELDLQLSDLEEEVSFGDKTKSSIERLALTERLSRMSEWCDTISPVRKANKSLWDSQDGKSPLKVHPRDASSYSDIEVEKSLWVKSQENEIMKSELDSNNSLIKQLKQSLSDLRKEANFKDQALERLRKHLRSFETRAEKLERLANKYKKKLLSVKKMSQTCGQSETSEDRHSAEALVNAIERRVQALKEEYEQAYTAKVLELNSQMNYKVIGLKETYEVALQSLRTAHESQIKRLEEAIQKQSAEAPLPFCSRLAVHGCEGLSIMPGNKEKVKNESVDMRAIWKVESELEELTHMHLKACRKIHSLQEDSQLLLIKQDALAEENLSLRGQLTQAESDLEAEAKARWTALSTNEQLRRELFEAENKAKSIEKLWEDKFVEQKHTHFKSLAFHETQLEQALKNYEEVRSKLAILKSKKGNRIDKTELKDSMTQTKDLMGDAWDLLSLCLDFEMKLESLKNDAKALLEYCENSHLGRRPSISDNIEGSDAPSLYMQVRSLKSTIENRLSELLARIDAFQEDKKADRTRLLGSGRDFSSLECSQDPEKLAVSRSYETPDLKGFDRIKWTHKRFSTFRNIENLQLDFGLVDETNLFNKPSPSFCENQIRKDPHFAF